MILGTLAQFQRAIFNPMSLFMNGEPGVWYDPSDLSTLFQDSNGVTPVTATGQPVGLMLDKHLGLVRGTEINTAGVNGWTAGRSATLTIVGGLLRVSPGAELSPYATKSFTTVIGQWYELVVPIPSGSSSSIQSTVRIGDTAGIGSVYSEPLTTGFRTRTVKFVAATTTTVVTLLHTGNSAGDYMNFGAASLKTLPGSHARQATQPSRPIYREGDGLRWLEFDGVDDMLQSPFVDMSQTDKLSITVGLNKGSDADIAIFMELGASPSTGWTIFAPRNAAQAGYGIRARGTSQVDVNSPLTYPAPNTVVITELASITPSSLSMRIDGAVIGTNNTSQGTGNYSNTSLNIGRREGATFYPFNGKFYAAIVRGATSTASEVILTERYIGIKTGKAL